MTWVEEVCKLILIVQGTNTAASQSMVTSVFADMAISPPTKAVVGVILVRHLSSTGDVFVHVKAAHLRIKTTFATLPRYT
jgi:hypothetical protein